MYSRILVPLDGSPLAEQALPYAQVIAGAFGAELELFQALPERPRPEDEKAAHESVAVGSEAAAGEGEWSQTYEQARLEATDSLQQPAAVLREAGLSVRTALADGDPAEAIAQEASAVPDTLIVMTTHGRSGIGRWLMGSVTDKTVRLAATPTLVIRSQEEAAGARAVPRIQRIILPLDGSPLAEQAIPHAVALGSALRAQVEPLRALSQPMYVPAQYPIVGAIPSPGFQPRGQAEQYLESIVQRLHTEGAPTAEPRTVRGDAASCILEAVEGTPDALVVMSTHGRSGIGRWLIGSVADKVVRHSGRPVLLVRAKEEAAQQAA